MHDVAKQLERLCQRVEQLLRHQGAVFAFFNAQQRAQVLVAAHACQQVGIAQGLAQALAHLPQQFVAGFAAQRVVDGGEAVQVQRHHGTALAAAAGARQGLVQQLVEQAAVGQAGQVVVVGEALHALFGSALHADVGKHRERVLHLALAVAHHADRDRLRKQLAILAPTNDLTLPGAGTVQGRLHFLAEIRRVHARAQQVHGLAYGFLRAVAGDAAERRVDRDNALVARGDQNALVTVFDDAGMQAQLVVQRHRLAHLLQVRHHADRLVVGVAHQRQRHVGPERLTGLFAPAHPHAALARTVLHFRHLGTGVLGIQRQHMLTHGLGRAVAKQGLRRLVPAGQVAGQVQRDQRLLQLVEHGMRFQRRVAQRPGPGAGAQLLQMLEQKIQSFRLLRPICLLRFAHQAEAVRNAWISHGRHPDGRLGQRHTPRHRLRHGHC